MMRTEITGAYPGSRWENYKTAFDRLNIFTAYKNSIIVSCCVAVVVILLAGMASYALATAGIFSFLWSCNDLFSQTFFLRFKDQWAITRLLMEISSREGTDYGLMAAVVTLIIVPLLVVYVCLQKYIIKGMTAGAVKG